MHAVIRSPSEPGRLGMALFATVIFAIGFLVVYRVLAGPRIVQLARPGRQRHDALNARSAGRGGRAAERCAVAS